MSAPPTAPGSPVDEAAEHLLDELAARFAAARPASAALHRRAGEVLPGGNTRTPLFHEPYPTYLVSGQGSRVVDADGLEYVDLVNNYTSLVHGHPSGQATTELADRARAGTALGAPTPLEVELAAELVERIGSVERVRFVNSGTEAVLYAVRTARAYTGRDDVVKAEGGYHGGAESMQVSVKSLGVDGAGVVEAGVPGAVAASTHVVPFNDAQAAQAEIRRLGDRLAAVVVEPVQGGAGALPAEPEYLQALRRASEEVGALLVFDEVMTLRLDHGGMQSAYGVRPDLTAMGKIIGGGLPVGAFGGRAEVMDVWDPRASRPLYHAGTFNGNPVTMVAGLRSLRELTAERIAAINATGDRLRGFIDERAGHHRVPVTASGIGSVLQVHSGHQPPRSFRDAATRSKTLVRCLHLLLLEHGVFTAPRGAMNISTALTDGDLTVVEEAIEASLRQVAAALTDARVTG